MSEWFPFNIGLREGCESPWLFNVYMDGVGREENARVVMKGLKLLRAIGGNFEMNHPLFADNTALLAN